MAILTNNMRDAIKRGLLARRYNPAVKALVAAHAGWVRLAYREALGFAKPRARNPLLRLPRHWTPEAYGVGFKAEEQGHYVGFSGVFSTARYVPHASRKIALVAGGGGGYNGVDLSPADIALRVPYGWLSGNFPFTELPAYVQKDFFSLLREREATYEDLHRREVELVAALRRFTTVEKLLKEWPEVQPFLPRATAQQAKAASLPAVPVAELNAAFRLPISAKEDA